MKNECRRSKCWTLIHTRRQVYTKPIPRLGRVCTVAQIGRILLRMEHDLQTLLIMCDTVLITVRNFSNAYIMLVISRHVEHVELYSVNDCFSVRYSFTAEFKRRLHESHSSLSDTQLCIEECVTYVFSNFLQSTRDGFEDTMFEAKAKARQPRGQGQTTSRPCRGLSLTYSI